VFTTACPSPKPFVIFRNRQLFFFDELLASRPAPKLKEKPLSYARDCLFNIFAATIHIWRPSPPSATRRHHTVVTGAHTTCTAPHVFFCRSFSNTIPTVSNVGFISLPSVTGTLLPRLISEAECAIKVRKQ
jgi:hypothetical protein